MRRIAATPQPVQTKVAPQSPLFQAVALIASHGYTADLTAEPVSVARSRFDVASLIDFRFYEPG